MAGALGVPETGTPRAPEWPAVGRQFGWTNTATVRAGTEKEPLPES